MRSILLGGVLAAALGAGISSASAAVVYGLTTDNNLFSFNSATPGTIDTAVFITGVATNESVLGIDFRPATGELYALGSKNNLYTLSPESGAATLVGAGIGLTLNGTTFGFDFNPVIDRIRVVSDTDRNYVLNPDTGAGTQVTNLFYGPGDVNEGVNPNVVGSAYTNNFAGTTSTQLFGVDSRLDILVTQANSAGTLATVGDLGTNTTNLVGFDIESGTGTAFIAYQPGPSSLFGTVNLATGAVTTIGEIGSGDLISDITVAIPEPTSLAAIALAGTALLRRRK